MAKIGQFCAEVWKRFARPVKLPGWFLILFWIVTNIPDWKARYDYWLGWLPQVFGALSFMALALQSPLFGVIILALGVGYVVFVGEPKRGLSAHWWPYVGMTTASLLALAVFLAMFAGYIASVVSPPQRHLTATQQQIIVREASALAPYFKNDKGQQMSLIVESVDTPEADAYTIEIMTALLAGKINQATTAPGILAPIPLRVLNPRIRGVFFQVRDPAKPPKLEQKLAKILEDAGIPIYLSPNKTLNWPDFVLSVALP